MYLIYFLFPFFLSLFPYLIISWDSEFIPSLIPPKLKCRVRHSIITIMHVSGWWEREGSRWVKKLKVLSCKGRNKERKLKLFQSYKTKFTKHGIRTQIQFSTHRARRNGMPFQSSLRKARDENGRIILPYSVDPCGDQSKGSVHILGKNGAQQPRVKLRSRRWTLSGLGPKRWKGGGSIGSQLEAARAAHHDDSLER